MQLFLHNILFGENFIGKVKEHLYSLCLNLNHKKNKILPKNVKVEKMVVFVKTFDHYHYKSNFGHFFSCPVKL